MSFIALVPTQGASLVAQLVNNLPAMQETRVPSLGWEDPLEKGLSAPSILARGTLWTEESGRLQSTGSQRVRHNLATKPAPPNPRLERTSSR